MGWLAWQTAQPNGALPVGPLVFERQRLPGAVYLRGHELAALTAELGSFLRARLEPPRDPVPAPPGPRPVTVTLHVFAPDPTGTQSQSGRAARLERRLRERWPREFPTLGLEAEPMARPGALVWQVCLLADGLWTSLAPAEALADPSPGGVHRMVRAEAAPSRSVLKIEEALELLGRPPQARERVIDLGAAPGGWSYAFLQRGCRVLAVDNAALKLPGLDDLPGQLTHLRADGLRLQPPPGWAPADWLLSDMLVAPGVCLGLLRKWIEAGWMRRFIVNVKLPQREPLVALRPLQAYLAGVTGLRWRMRQLYHDRREVTVLGELAAQRPVRLPASDAAARAEAPRGRQDAPRRAHGLARPAHRAARTAQPASRRARSAAQPARRVPSAAQPAPRAHRPTEAARRRRGHPRKARRA